MKLILQFYFLVVFSSSKFFVYWPIADFYVLQRDKLFGYHHETCLFYLEICVLKTLNPKCKKTSYGKKLYCPFEWRRSLLFTNLPTALRACGFFLLPIVATETLDSNAEVYCELSICFTQDYFLHYENCRGLCYIIYVFNKIQLYLQLKEIDICPFVFCRQFSFSGKIRVDCGLLNCICLTMLAPSPNIKPVHLTV